MDQTDLWQVVPRQVFTPYDCLLISVAFVVLCPADCFWVKLTGLDQTDLWQVVPQTGIYSL